MNMPLIPLAATGPRRSAAVLASLAGLALTAWLAWSDAGWPGGAAVVAAGVCAAIASRNVVFPPGNAATDGGRRPPPELRTRLEDGLQAGLDDAAAVGREPACIVLRLDDPRGLGDAYGATAVELAMTRISDRVLACLRPADQVVRLGDDRLAIALAPMRRADLESLIQICARLQTAAQEPLSIDAATAPLACSLGFCLAGRAPGRSGRGLLEAAEIAADAAWRSGPSAIRAFAGGLTGSSGPLQTGADSLAAALAHGEFVTLFQPQISTETGKVSGFEALARWDHPAKGLLPPAEFLEALRASGLASRLGESMLFQSLSALRAWDRAGFAVPRVAVNLCKEELEDPHLADRVKWELDRFDVAPDRLAIEIHEDVVADADSDVIARNVAALAGLGCLIDLDDFGTGRAAMTSIRRFGVHRIKIDRSFVARADRDPAQQRMVAAIVSMAETLGLDTLAEGVETVGEHAILAQIGCRHVQGFAVARPMLLADSHGWLAAHAAKLVSALPGGRRAG